MTVAAPAVRGLPIIHKSDPPIQTALETFSLQTGKTDSVPERLSNRAYVQLSSAPSLLLKAPDANGYVER